MKSVQKLREVENPLQHEPKPTTHLFTKGRVFRKAWLTANEDGIDVSISASKRPFSNGKYAVAYRPDAYGVMSYVDTGNLPSVVDELSRLPHGDVVIELVKIVSKALRDPIKVVKDRFSSS